MNLGYFNTKKLNYFVNISVILRKLKYEVVAATYGHVIKIAITKQIFMAIKSVNLRHNAC